MGKDSKRKKNYYMPNNKRQKTSGEVVGSVGYLGSCNGREDIAIRECYDLLNMYADRLYGPMEGSDTKNNEKSDEKNEKNDEKNDSDDEESEEEDMDAALEKELTVARSKKRTDYRFQAIHCGVSQNIFIRSSLSDPLPTLVAAMEDISSSGQARTRALARLLPVQCICPARNKDLEKAFATFCEGRFDNTKNFYVIVKLKHTNTITKDDVMGIVLKVMKEVAPGCEAKIGDAETTLLLTVLKTVCYISEAPRYEHFRKYNLAQLAVPTVGAAKAEKVSQETKAEETSSTGEKVDASGVAEAVEASGEAKTESNSTEADQSTPSLPKVAEASEASSDQSEEAKSQEGC